MSEFVFILIYIFSAITIELTSSSLSEILRIPHIHHRRLHYWRLFEFISYYGFLSDSHHITLQDYFLIS